MAVKFMRLGYRFWEWLGRWRWWTLTRINRDFLFFPLFGRTRLIKLNEQKRIARHLHDTLGPDLAFLCLKLDQLSKTQPIADSAALLSEIESMHSVANNAYEQVRNLLDELRRQPYATASKDWVSHIKECALVIGERARFSVKIETPGSPVILPTQIQHEILYLVREILRNIEKHAHARNVTVSFEGIDKGISVKISDDGQGFKVSRAQNANGHHGIRIIQEIVKELHGSLTVKSEPANGTQVSLWLPINQHL